MGKITYISLLYIIVLTIPTFIINYRINLDINKKLAISIIRMILQLSLVGLYLQYIFDVNNSFLNLAYLLMMVGVATYSAIKSTNLSFSKMLLPIFVSILIPNIFMVIYFNAFVIALNNPLEARHLITINGMILGNILSGDIVGLGSFYKSIKENKKHINYILSLGASRYQALKPFLKNALGIMIMPTISSMATIGLVSLPGMMTGQILGGSVPMEAILYQIAIMIAIYVSRYFCLLAGIYLSQSSMFDCKDQLLD